MKHSWRPLAVAVFALLIAVPTAFAQSMPILPEASVFPVTEPTDVGGTILQPGTYLIRVLGSAQGRNRIQITSQDKQTVYATVLTVPHELEPTEDVPNTTFVYFPASEGRPRALRTWFASDPPGRHGHDIVYDENRAKELARLANARVVSHPIDTDAEELETSTLSVITPEATVETYTYTPPASTTLTETTTTETPMTSSTQIAESNTVEMPATASNLPLFALLGLLSLVGAAALRFVR